MNVDAAERSNLTESTAVKSGISKPYQELGKHTECASSAETAARRPSLRHHQDPCSRTLDLTVSGTVCPTAQSEDLHTSALTCSKTNRTSRISFVLQNTGLNQA